MSDEVFKDYEFDDNMKNLFGKLRKEVPKQIDDRLLAVIIRCKKTYEKCISSSKKVLEVIKETNFGKIELNEKLFDAYFKKCFLFDPDLKTKEGFHLMVGNTPRMIKILKDRTLKEKMEVFMYHFHTLINNYPKVTTKGIVICLIGTGMGITSMDFQLAKSFHTALKRLPIRPKKIVILDAPWYVSFILSLIKPFMSKKILSRMEMTNKDGVEKVFGKENLFEEFGGKKKFELEKNLLRFYCKGDKKLFDKFYKGGKKSSDVNVVDIMEDGKKEDELTEEEKKKIQEDIIKKYNEDTKK